jgi:hypothetical protein
MANTFVGNRLVLIYISNNYDVNLKDSDDGL